MNGFFMNTFTYEYRVCRCCPVGRIFIYMLTRQVCINFDILLTYVVTTRL